jgi:hypothetical protein
LPRIGGAATAGRCQTQQPSASNQSYVNPHHCVSMLRLC